MKSRRKPNRPAPVPPPRGEMSLPHERDEFPETPKSAAQAAHETRGPREVIAQAARDISRGLRDTDRHGTPSDVPGPGADPEHSPGAEVPPEGIDRGGYSKPGERGDSSRRP